MSNHRAPASREAITAIRWSAVDILVSRIAGLVLYVLVARVVGPQEMGVVALVLVTIEVTRVISEFGLSNAVIFHDDLSGRQLSTLYSVNWLLGLSAFACVWFVSPVMANIFGDVRLTDLLRMAALVFLIGSVGQQVRALLQKELDFRALAKISVASATSNLAVGLVGLAAGLGVWALIYSYLVAELVRNLLFIIVGVPRGLFNKPGLVVAGIKDPLKFAAFRAGANGVNLVASRADQFIISALLGNGALGLYSMAMNWTLMPMQQLNAIATRVAFPVIASRRRQDDRVRDAYFRLINRATTVNAAFLLGVAALSEPLVSVLLGESWARLAEILPYVSVYVLLRSLGSLNGPLVVGLGKANWAFYWNLGLLVVMPSIIYIVALGGDLVAIIQVIAVAQGIVALASYRFWIVRLLGPCGRRYSRAIASALMPAACAAIGVVLILDVTSTLSRTGQLALALVSGAVVFIAISRIVNRAAYAEMLSFWRTRLIARCTAK